MRAQDSHIQDIAALPAQLDAAAVRASITALSSWPTALSTNDKAIRCAQRDRSQPRPDAIPTQVAAQYGLVVKRRAAHLPHPRARSAASVTRPTASGNRHCSPVTRSPWSIAVPTAAGCSCTASYSAWIEADAIARAAGAARLRREGTVPDRHRCHRAVPPGGAARPRLQLDMGVRLPVLADWPAANRMGQQAHASCGAVAGTRSRWSIEAGACLPRSQDTAADTAADPAPALQQALFLGERYGWGHDYDTRDCSVRLRDLPQLRRAAATLDRLPFTGKAAAVRDRAVTRLQVGDLVYIPGHVMMAIGHVDGRTCDPRYGGRQLVRCRRQTCAGPSQWCFGHAAGADDGQRHRPLHRPHHQHPAPAGQDS